MILSTTLGVVLILTILGYYYLYYRPKKACNSLTQSLQSLGYKVYVYPFKFLGLPRLQQMRQNAVKYKDCRYSQKHQLAGYDAAVSNVIASPCLVLFNHQLIKHTLTPDMISLLRKKASFGKVVQAIMPTGLVFSEGQQWRHARKLLSKVFNYDFVTSQIPLISQTCDRILDEYQAASVKEGTSEGNVYQIDILKALTDIFATVVLSSFLGIEASQDTINQMTIQNAVLDLFHDALNLLRQSVALLIMGPRLLKLRLTQSHRDFKRKETNVRNFIRRKIHSVANSMKQGETKVSSIIEAIIIDNKQEGDKTYSEERMIDEVITFIFAGSDTTSNMLNFAIRAVHQYPDVLKRAQEEVDSLIRSNQDITQESLKKMVYLQAIQHQTNRMYGPLNGLVARASEKDILIGDIPVPGGAQVNSDFKPMFYDPSIFEDPHVFRPERWLNCPTQMVGMVGMAFSGGSRTCIGKHLALLQSKIALIKLIQRYSKLEELDERVIEFGGVDSYKHNRVKVTSRQ